MIIKTMGEGDQTKEELPVKVGYCLYARKSTESEVFQLKNSYFILGTLFLLVPAVAIAVKFPKIIKKFTFTVIYFSIVMACFEFTAVYLDQWVFPGAYIVPTLRFVGKPLVWEEIFFCFFVAPFFALACYEFFDDDQK